MRMSNWISDVCSSDLLLVPDQRSGYAESLVVTGMSGPCPSRTPRTRRTQRRGRIAILGTLGTLLGHSGGFLRATAGVRSGSLVGWFAVLAEVLPGHPLAPTDRKRVV